MMIVKNASQVIRLLQNPFVMLLTLPAGIAFCIGVLSPIVVLLERTFSTGAASPFVLQFDAESARSLLSVVSAASITALSLAYSLVLVVFTLAAGNIGPRLLKRFSSDPVNQVTAGIFGGTFLYALITIVFVQDDFVPKITIAGSVLLAILCVFQLIFFVRHVSRSVSIDDEIAEISEQLTRALDRHIRQLEDNSEPPEVDCDRELVAGKAGYVGAVDEDALIELGRKQDLVIRLVALPGGFLLGDETLALLSEDVDDDVADDIRALIAIEPSRSQTRPIEFSIHLLVEIALRALSPGVNDAYTAIAAIDSLSNAFARIAGKSFPSPCFVDGDGEPRLLMPALSVKSLIGQAFHPLRRAAAENLLVAQALARALSRLHDVDGSTIDEVIAKHAALLVDELEKAEHFEHDIGSVTECLPAKFRGEYVS